MESNETQKENIKPLTNEIKNCIISNTSIYDSLKEPQRLSQIPKESNIATNSKLTYEEIVDAEISNLKETTQDYIRNLPSKLETMYETFRKDILLYMSSQISKINNTFDIQGSNPSIYRYTFKTVKKPIENILVIHNKIFESIQETIQILESLLEINKFITKEKPCEEFLINNITSIYQSSLFLKLDYNKYDIYTLFNSQCLSENVINFFIKNPLNKFSTFRITTEQTSYYNDTNTRFQEIDSKIVNQNRDVLKKLKFLKIKELPPFITDITFPNVKKVDLSHSPFKLIQYCKKTFPNIESISIQNMSLDLNEINVLSHLHMNLQSLRFIRLDLINSSFNKIMTIIANSDELRNNITHLDFSDNFISVVDFGQFLFQPKKMHKLKEINFSKNKIYKFLMNPDSVPSLKVLNLTSNALGKSYFSGFKKDKIILLLSNNIYLSSPNNYQQYFETLKYQLENIDYNLESLSLIGLFSKTSRDKLKELKLNKNILISVKTLDLSNCSLDYQTLFYFLKVNSGLFELRNLHLTGNYLSDEFFSKFIEYGFHETFRKLKFIYLHNNDIKDKGLEYAKIFIEKNLSLTAMFLCRNPFDKEYMIKEMKSPTKNAPTEVDETINDEITPSQDDPTKEEKLTPLANLIKVVQTIHNKDKDPHRNYIKIDQGFLLRFDVSNQINCKSYDFDYTRLEYTNKIQEE